MHMVIQALKKEHLEAAWKAFSGKVQSVDITETVTIKLFQLKFLEDVHHKRLQEIQTQMKLKVKIPTTLDLKSAHDSLESEHKIILQGLAQYVSSAVIELKGLIAFPVLESCTVQCPKVYFGVWRKRWDIFKANQRREHDVLIENHCDEDGSTMRVIFYIYGPQTAVQNARMLVIKKENGENNRTHSVDHELSSEQLQSVQDNLNELQQKLEDQCAVCLRIETSRKKVLITYPSTANIQITDVINILIKLVPKMQEIRFDCSAEQAHYLKVCLFDTQHLSSLKQVLPTKIILKHPKIVLVGYDSKIKNSQDLLNRYLLGLKFEYVTYECNVKESSIYERLLKEFHIPNNSLSGIVCIVQERRPLTVKICGHKEVDIKATVEGLKVIKTKNMLL